MICNKIFFSVLSLVFVFTSRLCPMLGEKSREVEATVVCCRHEQCSFEIIFWDRDCFESNKKFSVFLDKFFFKLLKHLESHKPEVSRRNILSQCDCCHQWVYDDKFSLNQWQKLVCFYVHIFSSDKHLGLGIEQNYLVKIVVEQLGKLFEPRQLVPNHQTNNTNNTN